MVIDCKTHVVVYVMLCYSGGKVVLSSGEQIRERGRIREKKKKKRKKKFWIISSHIKKKN